MISCLARSVCWWGWVPVPQTSDLPANCTHHNLQAWRMTCIPLLPSSSPAGCWFFQLAIKYGTCQPLLLVSVAFCQKAVYASSCPSAGCWFFQLAIKYGIVPDTVYMIHINTLPETK